MQLIFLYLVCVYYQVGFTNDGEVLALDLELFNNGGNTLDLSSSVLERAMFHSDNVYRIPNVRVKGQVCYTNFPSNTAFRGFGGPQGMLIAENWIQRVAMDLQKSPEEIRVTFLSVIIVNCKDYYCHYRVCKNHVSFFGVTRKSTSMTKDIYCTMDRNLKTVH